MTPSPTRKFAAAGLALLADGCLQAACPARAIVITREIVESNASL